MQLNKLVNINMHFQNSINLSLDLNNIEKINNYIPTDSGLIFLNYYLDTMLKPNSDRSTMMIAPYGKGKSHSILVLISLLSLNDFTSIQQLLNKIRGLDEDLYQKILKIEKKQYMPVIISNTRGSLSQALATSLKKALINEELTDITLNSEFDEAVNRINDWKKNYPATYESLRNELKTRKISINSLMTKLEEYDEISLDTFKNIHKKILSGAQFVNDSNIEVADYYQEVSEIITTIYGYSGMFIVFDEFTKFLESRDVDTVSNDMKIIQDFAELANSAINQKITFQLVLHKPISEYESMPKVIKNAFKGIEGRVSSYYFTATLKNSFDLISNVLEKKEESKALIDNYITTYHKFLVDSLEVPVIALEFEEDYRYQLLFYDIYPLLPLSAYILVRINEKVAQNERTLFTFLAKDAKNTLLNVIERDFSKPFILPSIIFDYFENQFLEERDNLHLKKIANSAISALTSTDDINERDFIKTLALILMINDKALLPSNISIIKNALLLNDDELNLILKSLMSKNIIIERAGGVIEFKVNIGFNIEKEINELINRKYSTVKIEYELNNRFQSKYVYPRLYNTMNAITRYYICEFINAKDFLELSDISYFFENDFRDGLILNILPNEKYKLIDIEDKIQKLNCERLVVVYPKKKRNYMKIIQWLLAIEYLQDDDKFKESHNLVSAELDLFHEDYMSILAKNLSEDYGIESKNNYLLNTYRKNELNAKMRNISKNRVLGEIFTHTFNQYPIINLEMLNKWKVIGTYKKARVEVNDLLLSDNYDFTNLGTSPKDTIVNCVLKTTKILDKSPDVNMQNVISTMSNFFKKGNGNFNELYSVLNTPPIGLRYGVIPVLVSYVIGKLPFKIIIKKKGIEQELTGMLIDETIDNPQDFEFHIDKITEEKQRYLESFSKLFNTNFDLTTLNPYNDLYFSLRKWYLSLPHLTKDMIGKDSSIKNNNYRYIKKICNTQNLNSSEVILGLLPEVDDFNNKLKEVTKIKSTLDMYINGYKNVVKDSINIMLGYPEGTNLSQSLINWYLDNKQVLENKILDSSQRQFINLCKMANQFDEFTLINKIAYIYINLFVEDWSINTIDEFENEFSKIKLLLNSETKTLNQITIQMGDNVVNKFFDDEDDPMAEMVQERIVDAISDFGELLSDEQKIALLVRIMKKYI